MKLNFSNKNWVVLSTVIVIGVAFSIYFLVHVKGKEKAIVSNNFRVLQQVVKNIKFLENSFLDNAIIKSNTINNEEVNKKLDTLTDNQFSNIRLMQNSGYRINYGHDGLYFIVFNSTQNSYNYYFTSYQVFFNNPLFHRKDVFDQIIITGNIKGNESVASLKKVLYANEPIGIRDSAFYEKSQVRAKDELSINDSEYISFNQEIDIDQEIYISGLILKSTFEQQKRSVSPFTIFILSIALTLIILAMPLLKLKIMSQEERLYIRDVMFNVISVLVGPAVFMIFLYTSLAFFGREKTKLHEKLKSKSIKIEYNFRQEMHMIVNQIDKLNIRFPNVINNSILRNSTFSLPKDNLLSSPKDSRVSLFKNVPQKDNNRYEVSGYQVFEDVITNDSIDFKHLKAAFWCDEKFRIMVLLSAFHEPGYAQDLGHRKYLTDIMDGKPSMFKDTSGKIHEIAIESIKSVTDGSYEVGVGKKSGGSVLPITAISTKLASVMGNILEEGYGFCIIDKKGNTLFHSDITKNMNENFIDETKDAFRHAMDSQTDYLNVVSYNGKNQIIYFRPMNYLSDHYIVTFINSETYYAPFTLSMISTFILFICYLLLLLFVFLVLYYSTFKGIKLRQSFFMLNFLRPYETDLHHRKYKRLISVSLIVIVYLVLSSIINRSHYDFLISDLLIVSIALLVFSFYSLSKYIPEQKIMHTSFQNQNQNDKGFKVIAVIFFVGLIARILNYLIDNQLSLMLNAIIELFVVMIIMAETYYDKHKPETHDENNMSLSVENHQQIYKRFLFLWVIILSVIPVNLFLRITYEKESSIFAKYGSHELLLNINNWEPNNEYEFADKFEHDGDYKVFANSMKQFEIQQYLDEIKDTIPKIGEDTIRDPNFNIFYKKIRLKLNERSTATRDFINSRASDSSWVYLANADTGIFRFNRVYGQEFTNDSISINRVNFLKQNWTYIIIITIISLIILMKFLSFALDKIYGFKYKKYAIKSGKINSYSFSSYFLKSDYFSNDSSYNNIFIVSINAANTSHIKNYLDDKYKDSFFTLDLYDFDAKVDFDGVSKEIVDVLKLKRLKSDWEKIKENFGKKGKQAYILIEHFEYGYNDILMNKLKLEALKYLVDCEHFKVLISSEINATKLFQFYEDAIKKLYEFSSKADSESKQELQQKIDDLKVDYKKWQHLLGSFVNCVIPLNKFHHEEELGKGEFLDMVWKYIGGANDTDLSAEDRILAIQQMSYSYYFSVWNSLSKDERYIAYDIAQDKFVNTINTIGILSLLEKGILIYDHSLRLLNESFANFVLTKVSSDEALEMEMAGRKKGSWNTAFAVLILLIVSLVIFLSIGQQNFLDDFSTFLTTIVALFGLLIRFSGFMSFGGNKGGA